MLAKPEPQRAVAVGSSAIFLDGNCAISTEISSTMVHSRQACSKAATSKRLSASRNIIRLSEARLQAVSSRNMYSEHGFDARIGPDFGQVCQSLMVVWNWMPGSAEAQAAWPIFSHRSRALSVLTVLAAEARGQRPVPVLLDRAAGTRR